MVQQWHTYICGRAADQDTVWEHWADLFDALGRTEARRRDVYRLLGHADAARRATMDTNDLMSRGPFVWGLAPDDAPADGPLIFGFPYDGDRRVIVMVSQVEIELDASWVIVGQTMTVTRDGATGVDVAARWVVECPWKTLR